MTQNPQNQNQVQEDDDDDDEDNDDDNARQDGENPEHEIEFQDMDDEEGSEDPLFHNYDGEDNEEEDVNRIHPYDARRHASREARTIQPSREGGRKRFVNPKFHGVHNKKYQINFAGVHFNTPEVKKFLYYNHLHATADQTQEYSVDEAQALAMIMMHYKEKLNGMDESQAIMFIQNYSLKKAEKKWGDRATKAAHKELKQLDNRIVFEPIDVNVLNPMERKRVMESLLFLVEKRDGTIKARACANGSVQHEYISREEATSPTAATESILITGVVEAKQERDVMTLDVPNAFVQTDVVHKEGERIIMKIRGALVEILLEIDPEKYQRFVTYQNGKKVLYVKMLKALYGMLVSSILYYKKFRADIESIGFEVNPYDVCVANRMVSGSQHTITFHVDDVKSSHIDPKVNDEFYQWCEMMYGSEELGHVKNIRGPKHDYFAMIMDYSQKGAVKIDMRYYIEAMKRDFPYMNEVKPTTKTPWSESLFKLNSNEKKLHHKQS